MKALGIPNNKDFFKVTQIRDAQALWKTIQVCGERHLVWLVAGDGVSAVQLACRRARPSDGRRVGGC
jgi:hypothetical protein